MENYFQMKLSHNQVNAITALGLAHMGDAVFEILCRSYLCAAGDLTNQRLHRETVALVNASAQAGFSDVIQPYLSEAETDYFRRGKNAHVHVPKSASPKDYAKATGLEALFGALYLQGQTDRLNELFQLMMESR